MKSDSRKRPSSIDKLPDDIREQLNALLRDPRVTQLEATGRINAILEEEGLAENVSKSAVNRYSKKMDKIGKKMMESRQVAEMWIDKMGAAPAGKTGTLINEMLRTLALDIQLVLQDGELNAETLPGVIDSMKHLSLVIQRLEQAAALNTKTEQAIRQKLLDEQRKALETMPIKGGVTNETKQAIREALGIV